MTQLPSTLTAVAVYTDRARLTRSGKADLEPGIHQLEIKDLPIQLDQDSVRASARGSAQARLLGVQVQRTFSEETPAEHIRELEAQIEAAQDEQAALDARAELVKQHRLTLNTLSSHTDIYATALASGEMSVETQMALFDGLRARAGELDAELQDLSSRRRELDRRLQKLKNELGQWRGGQRREQFTAIVEVEMLQQGSLEVELAYVVYNAGWQPLYDLRLVEEAGGRALLDVGYLAQVTQRTGENWQDVALTLSTARPALAATLPELNPWYIQPMPPPRPVAPAPQMAKMEMAYRDTGATPEAAAPAEMLAMAAPVTASVETSGAAVTYHIPGTVTIPADGAPHKVTVALFQLDPRLDYVSAPKLVEAAYRRATAANDSPYTLLPGPANLFAGDEFIGAIHLELTASQAEIELYLGPDDRLKVERELKRREVDRRLIGNRRRQFFGYEIRIENLLPVEARLSLQDQLPVARHEDIKVKLEMAEPRPTEHSELNLLKWDLTLAPGEKRTLRFDFSVEYPQAMQLIGLD